MLCIHVDSAGSPAEAVLSQLGLLANTHILAGMLGRRRQLSRFGAQLSIEVLWRSLCPAAKDGTALVGSFAFL